MIGFDTGFFVKLLRADGRAITIWRQIVSGKKTGVSSCLTLFELERLALQGALDRTKASALIAEIPRACQVAWLTSAAITNRAARISHSAGLPGIDALILAGVAAAGARTVYTTDDWSTASVKPVKIVRL